MNATITIQELNTLRNEFREYLRTLHPEWADNTVSMLYSDAFFGLNNNIGIDFWSSLISDESLLVAHDKIKDHFEAKGYDGPKAFELIRKYKRLMQTYEIVDIMQAVIDEFAAFFFVSRAAAKIRLVDIGFEEAIGTFTYIDGRYVRPHRFKKGSLERNQTFSINQSDAVVEGALNPKLKEKLQSGAYLYVDSHFCLNIPKYIKTGEDGVPYITEYARLHADECCLVFDLHIKTGSRYGKDYYTECVLCRDDKSDIIFEAKFNNGQNTETPGNIETLRARNAELAELKRNLPSSFTGTLKVLMEWQDITVEALAECCGMSPKTIQRLRNNEECKTTLETIVALCIGLKLPPTTSYDLIGKSRFFFIASEKHMAYRFLLDGYYTHTLPECNELLIRLGVAPIGGEDI